MEMNRRIRERRLALNLTQEELAHRLGMQKSAIAKYESGRVENIKRSTLAKMSEILECSPAYLMGWDDADSQIPSFDNILPIQTKRVPLLGEIACGQPIFCTEDRESYVEAGTDVRADFCLKARGGQHGRCKDSGWRFGVHPKRCRAGERANLCGRNRRRSNTQTRLLRCKISGATADGGKLKIRSAHLHGRNPRPCSHSGQSGCLPERCKIAFPPRTREGDPETPYILAIGLQFSPHTRG